MRGVVNVERMLISRLRRIFAADSAGEKTTRPVKGGSQRARMSMSMRQAWFVIPFTAFLLMGGAGAAFYFYFSSPPTTLRFAVGSPASGDARLVQALAQQFVREGADIRLVPVTCCAITTPRHLSA